MIFIKNIIFKTWTFHENGPIFREILFSVIVTQLKCFEQKRANKLQISWQCHFKFMVWSESELFVRIWIQYRKVRILLNLEMPNTIQSKMWAYTYNQLFFLSYLYFKLYCIVCYCFYIFRSQMEELGMNIFKSLCIA